MPVSAQGAFPPGQPQCLCFPGACVPAPGAVGVCVGKGTEQSPALETQDVFLAKDKYTGVFHLITQCSIIPE